MTKMTYQVIISRGKNRGVATCQAESKEDAKWTFAHDPKLIGYKVDYRTVRTII